MRTTLATHILSSTSTPLSSTPTLASLPGRNPEATHQALLQNAASQTLPAPDMSSQRSTSSPDSTLNGVMIGLLSSFGSAILIAFIFLLVYFFRYTSSGRILLDRIGRPGEYDDEQAYAREEAEALEEMDDLQRAEYLRAKGL
jgi:hypothetical protein